MITWIIFDAMGVIFTIGDDTNELLVPFIQEYNSAIPRKTVNKFYLQTSLGKISARQFWTEVGLGSLYPAIEKRYLDTKLFLDEEFIEIAWEMSQQYRIALLSNDVSEWSLYLRKRHGLNFFSEIIVSCDVKCRKPDRTIFDSFLKISKATPQECVFVDDNCANLAAAQALGFKTLHFTRDGQNRCPTDAAIESFEELPDTIELLVSPLPQLL